MEDRKLLGGLPFVSRTFEGTFKENPFVLDMDANLYVGPADHEARDEHAGIEVVYHFLAERDRVLLPFKDLLRDRAALLDAFREFDESRRANGENEFRIYLFGTYDGVLLESVSDDLLPAGPCGLSVNDIKQRFYGLCRKLDKQFDSRKLTSEQRQAEQNFLEPG